MPYLQPLTTEKVLLIVGVLVLLAVISWRFNAYIDAQVDSDPMGSNSSTFTVLGVAYTLVGATAILFILFGGEIALTAIGIVLICFAASGIPMIFGDMQRGGRRRRAAIDSVARAHHHEE